MLPPAAHIPLALCDIDVPDGRRHVDPDAVKRIAKSIESIGLRHAISVRPQGERYLLVAGRHRLEAFKALDKDFIPAVVTRSSKLEAELWEIDENLCRNDLSPAELAAAIARRKTVHVQLNGSPKSKGAHAANAAMGQDHDATAKLADAFTSETSVAIGRSERTIQRDAQRGAALGQEMLAKVARTSLDSGQELDALAQLSIESREALVERATAGEKVSARAEFKKEHRAERERELGEQQQAFSATKYGVIVADPEWQFEPWSRETGLDRAADNHYPTSSLDLIKSRDVPSIAADDCVLFLWATAPMLPQALAVMDAWGFEYRSNYVWVKDRIGTGYWNRNAHEHLLVGVRGNIPAPAMGTQWDSVVEAPVGEHSAKPDVFLKMVEEYYPNLPKIELNCRGEGRPGWAVWGLEAKIEAAA